MSDKKPWGEPLLKSSLPLEHIVAQQLEESHFEIFGEYPYRKPDEFDKDTEFSVDLHAWCLLTDEGSSWWAVNNWGGSWGTLNLLVECKYSNRSIHWVFAPHPKKSTVMMSPSAIPCLEELTPHRLVGGSALDQLVIQLPKCTHGVSLHADGADPNAITRGLNQLRYGIPNLMASECETQINALLEKHLWISIISPILVTTAPLYVLKFDLSLDDFRNASSLDAVAEQEKFVVVHQQPGPQLRQYSNRVRVEMENRNGKRVTCRLQEADGCRRTLNPTDEHHDWSGWRFRERFLDAGYDIFVVTLDALAEFLGIVRKAAVDSGKGRTRIGSLTLDKDGDAHLTPLDQSTA